MAATVLYVYAGPGASPRCVRSIVRSLHRLHLGPAYRVKTLDAQALVRGSWRTDARLLVMPGGRDLPMLRHLAPRGTGHIRAFVAAGGRYLGLCAGAYFASACINFAPGDALCVRGVRPLRLFAGEAFGPLVPRGQRFNYGPEGGSEVRKVVGSPKFAAPKALGIYNHGGCAFRAISGSAWPASAQVLAHTWVDDALLPVCLIVQCGRGRALLWGMHPEFDAVDATALGAPRATIDALAEDEGLRQQLWAAQLRALIC